MNRTPAHLKKTPLYRKTSVLVIGAFVVYGLVSLLAYRPVLPGQSSRIPTCGCGDPALQVWFLRWVPYAIAHGHNPFFSSWTNYPLGVNLAQNPEMPLLGLLMAPLTVLDSPIASYTFLLWLAFPLSATAMFLVVRLWTRSVSGAFIAGLIYGFSAYVVGQATGHVMLSFVPLPPLFIYQLHQVVVHRKSSPYRQGLYLGVISIAQFFIASEILATLIIVSFLGLLFFLVATWKIVTPTDVVYVGKALACSGGLVVVALSYPVGFIELGLQHFSGPPHPIITSDHSSLLDPLISSRAQYFSSHLLSKYRRSIGYVENGSYVGLPLLVLATILVARFRLNRWMLFSALMVLVTFILSLGRRMSVVNKPTSVPLPFALLTHVPVLSSIIPSRFSLYTIMFLAITVGLGISELTQVLQHLAVRRRVLTDGRALFGFLTVGGVVALGALSGLSLVPKWPYPAAATNVPPFFSSSMVLRIPRASVVLAYPFPYYPDNQAMIWQAVSNMRFKEVGTYALVPSTKGTASQMPVLLSPPAVQDFLIREETTAPGKVPFPATDPTLVSSVREYLAIQHISTVVLDRSDTHLPGVTNVMALFVGALGSPEEIGGTAVWFDVPSLIRH